MDSRFFSLVFLDVLVGFEDWLLFVEILRVRVGVNISVNLVRRVT